MGPVMYKVSLKKIVKIYRVMIPTLIVLRSSLPANGPYQILMNYLKTLMMMVKEPPALMVCC